MDSERREQPSVFYRHFDLPPSFPVVGLLGDFWTQEPGEFSRLHFHNCLEIGYLYSGKGRFYIDDQIIPFEAPDITVIPPNMPHITVADEGCACGWKWLYVDPIQMLNGSDPRLVNEINFYFRTLGGQDCIIPAGREEKVFRLVEMIIDEMESDSKNYQAVVRELFHALFLMLVRISRTESADEKNYNNKLGSIAPAITYIQDHYMEDLCIEDLAKQCHISTSHFRRLFRQTMGWSPQEFLQLTRVERACTLLYNSDYSVTEIGTQVGFPSPSSFSRQFQRIYNMSPSRWRHKMKSEANPVVTAYFNGLPPSHRQIYPPEYHVVPEQEPPAPEDP